MIIKDDVKRKPWHKERYVWMVIFFPLLAVIGGIITTILAINSDDGLVVDDYYKKGLEINRTLERDQRAVGYQLNADINIDHKNEELAIRLIAVSDFVYPPELSVAFLHATRAGLDQQTKLLLSQERIYRGDLVRLEPGKWYVHIQHDNWRLIETINIP